MCRGRRQAHVRAGCGLGHHRELHRRRPALRLDGQGESRTRSPRAGTSGTTIQRATPTGLARVSTGTRPRSRMIRYTRSMSTALSPSAPSFSTTPLSGRDMSSRPSCVDSHQGGGGKGDHQCFKGGGGCPWQQIGARIQAHGQGTMNGRADSTRMQFVIISALSSRQLIS